MGKYLFSGNKANIVSFVFQTLLVTYLILLLIEQVWEGFVSLYFNLNYLLLAVIVLGVLDVFSAPTGKKIEKVMRKDYILTFFLGFLGFGIIKYKTSELGGISWIISVIAGILIILLSILILEEEDEVERFE